MTITNGYVTLAGLKEYLGISDTVEDGLLEQIAEAASRSIDRIANRRFYLDAVATARTYRPADILRVIVDDIGTTDGLTLKTEPDSAGNYQKTLVLGVDFIAEPTNSLAQGKPATFLTVVNNSAAFSLPVNYWPQVQATARWGWPTVPDDIVQACLILSADLYKRKDSIGGVLGLSELGAIRMSPLGRDIAAMVRAYRREFFA